MKRSFSKSTSKVENDVTSASSGLKKSVYSRIELNINALVVLLVLIFSFGTSPKQLYAQQSDVSLQLFYDELSPYGQWVDYPRYGYVWIPDAGQDFVPYSTDGHWVMTDNGWTWASDYEWGWAPFHYGRWAYDDSYGWLWVPGTEWGPSWVNWRSADGYYGWSPMEPGISLSMSFGRPYNSNYDHWMFVRSGDFDRPDINRYYVNRTDHDRLVRSSIVINRTYVDNSRHSTYAFGPAREDVQRASGRTVNRVAIQENNRPGQSLRNGQLNMYRPKMTNNNAKGQKPVPTKIANLRDVKGPSGRNAIVQPGNTNPVNNNNNKAQPSQTRNATPTNNNRGAQQPNTVNPQKSNVQPTQTRVTRPYANGGVNQGNKAVDKAQPSQPQKVNPSVKPANQQNINKTQPSQQQRMANPANNTGRQQQQRQQQQPQKQQPQQQQQQAKQPQQQPQQQQRPQQQQQRPQQQQKQQQQQRQQQQRQQQQPQKASPQKNEQPREAKPEQDKKQ